MQRLLHRVHDPGLDRVDVGGEVPDEVVLGKPGEALVVDAEVGQRGRRGTLREQAADRFALVEAEAGDVDEADHVGRVGTERGDDLAAVGVTGDKRRAALQAQHVA